MLMNIITRGLSPLVGEPDNVNEHDDKGLKPLVGELDN